MDLRTEFVAKFQTRKVRSWRSSYKRVFGLTKSEIVTIDPSDFSVTNRFSYASIRHVRPSETSSEEFSFDVDGVGAMQFRCHFRGHLLTELLRLRAFYLLEMGAVDSSTTGGLFQARKHDHHGSRRNCLLRVLPHALCEVEKTHDGGEKTLREYRILALQEIGSVEGEIGAFMLRVCGRPKLFFSDGRAELLRSLRAAAQFLGVVLPEVPVTGYSVDKLVMERRMFGSDLGAPIVTYQVEKVSSRHAYPVQRLLAVYPTHIAEKASATAATISIRPVKSIFALVRSATDGREVRFEYDDGDARTYLCGRRDALAASAYDAAIGAGNSRVVITSAVSDGLRLLPRHAVHEVSDRGFLTEAFFGPDTIEFFFLKRLSTVAEQCAILAAQAPTVLPDLPPPVQKVVGRRRVGNVSVPVIAAQDLEDGAERDATEENVERENVNDVDEPAASEHEHFVGASPLGTHSTEENVQSEEEQVAQSDANPAALEKEGDDSTEAAETVPITENETEESDIGVGEDEKDDEQDHRVAVESRRVYVAQASKPAGQHNEATGNDREEDAVANLNTAITLWGQGTAQSSGAEFFSWDDEDLLLAAAEFNANVPPSGVSAHLDKMYVKSSLQPICRILASLACPRVQGRQPEPLSERQAYLVSALLQAVYRICASTKGYKMLVEMDDVRSTFTYLLHHGQSDDTVAFWTVSILRRLMRCPLEPPNQEQERSNKSFFLVSPELREGLLDLLDTALSDLRHFPAARAATRGNDGVTSEMKPKPDSKIHQRGGTRLPGESKEVHSPVMTASTGEATDTRSTSDEIKSTDDAAAEEEVEEDFLSPQAAAAAKRRSDRLQARIEADADRKRQREREAELDFPDEDDDPRGTGAVSTTSDLVLMALSDLLEAILCSHAPTTPQFCQQQMLTLLSDRHEVLLCLLRTSCALTIENAALLLTALVTREPRISDAVAEAAMSEAVVLRHFYNGCFSPSTDQRFISRYLIQIWMSGSSAGSAKRLLRRMVPAAFLTYLNMPKLTEPEERNLDEIEVEHFRVSTQASSANSMASSANTERLRARLRITLEYSVGQHAQEEAAQARKQLAAAEAAAQKASLEASQQMQVANSSPVSSAQQSTGVPGQPATAQASGGMSLAPPPPAVDDPVPEAPQVQAQIAAKIAVKRREELKQRQRQAAAEVRRRLGQDNFRVLFFQLSQNQNLADLVWNGRTRQELRASLEAELKGFERQQALRGVGRVAWNHEQFHVKYESMSGELCVGGVYLRLFIEAGDSFVQSLPNPQRLFELLVRRMLVEADRNAALCNIAVRCLEKLYRVHHRKIGVFEDMDVVIAILARARDRELQARALQLLLSLGKYDENAEYLLSDAGVEVLVAAAVMCHRNPPTIGNDLSRSTNLLMLKDGASGNLSTQSDVSVDPTSLNGTTPSNENYVESENVVDANCPNMWYIAPPGRIPPPPRSETGPYRIPRLMELSALGELHDFCLCAPAATSGTYDDAEEDLDSRVDTGLWRPLSEHPTLRWVVRGTGPEAMRPGGFSLLALHMLYRLATLHRSVDARGVPFHPIPRAKQLLCRPSLIGPLTQCLLANDVDVVDTTAQVLTALVAHNPDVNAKMYRTGLFFFSLAHYGQNYVHVAKLLHATHLRQQNRGVDDAARIGYGISGATDRLPVQKRSALAPLLPPALVLYMYNYGYKKFAETFCGDIETPEVIWGPKMRERLIDLIGQHLGDFPLRLRQHPLLQYDYTPCPTIVYPQLEDELFCHNYYLRLLCDERRFPEWPVSEPVKLLYAALEFHRDEMKSPLDGGLGRERASQRDGALSYDQALELLGLKVGFGERDLRKAYRTLARKYHPDRNPQGRDMFEQVQAAYELLTSPKGKKALALRAKRNVSSDADEDEPDIDRLRLILHAQMLVYRRFSDVVMDYKYPAYPLLLQNLRDSLSQDASDDSPGCPSAENGKLAVCLRGVKLCFFTCRSSTGNTKELVRQGGVVVLFEVLHAMVNSMLNPVGDDGSVWMLSKVENETDATFSDSTERAQKVEVMQSCLEVLAHISLYGEGVEACLGIKEDLAQDLYILAGLQRIPKCVEFALANADNLCSHPDLQLALCSSGLPWRCLPLMLRYDAAADLQEAQDAYGDRETQLTSNRHARLATRALGRMGGYLLNELATPPQTYMQEALSDLLTPPLARLLRNKRADSLLTTLNKDVETPTRIWNGQMRAELMQKVQGVINERPARHMDAEDELLENGRGFEYSFLGKELCIGGVYIRLFVANATTSEIEDSVQFGVDLLRYVANSLETSSEERPEVLSALLALKELLLVDEHCIASLTELRGDFLGLKVIVLLLKTFSLKSEHFKVASALLGHLSPKEEFSAALCKHRQLFSLLVALSRARTKEEEKSEIERQMGGTGENRVASTVGGLGMAGTVGKVGGEEHCWDVLEALCSSTNAGREMLRVGGVPLLVVLLVGHPKFSSSMLARVGAMRCIVTMLKNQVVGVDTASMLSRVVPDGVVDAVLACPAIEAVNLFDSDHETPEIIWGASMRALLRRELIPAVDQYIEGDQHDDFHFPSATWRVLYPELRGELRVGGVYVRLFLKNPNFQLKDPMRFLEHLTAEALRRIEYALPRDAGGNGRQGPPPPTPGGVSTALVVREEDMLSVLVSAAVYVLRVRPGLAERSVQWGHVSRCATLLKGCNDATVTLGGGAGLALLRLLHQLMEAPSAVDAAATIPQANLLVEFRRSIEQDGTGYPPDAAFILEAMAKVVCSPCRPQSLKALLSTAIADGLVVWLLGVLEDKDDKLSDIRDPDAARVHIVQILKTLADHPEIGAHVGSVLDKSESWEQYTAQRQELYLTAEHRVDYFLTNDSHNVEALLLIAADDSQADDGPPVEAIEKQIPAGELLRGKVAIKQPVEEDKQSKTGVEVVAAASSATAVRVDGGGGSTGDDTVSKSGEGDAKRGAAQTRETQEPVDSSTRLGNADESASADVNSPSEESVKADATKGSESATPKAHSGPVPSSSAPAKVRIETFVRKSADGFGMDLAVVKGRLRIKKIKSGANNPARTANPPLEEGDEIELINGQSYKTAKEAVNMIRSADGAGLQLCIIRNPDSPAL